MPSTAAQELPPKWSAILEVQDPDGTRTRHPFRHPRTAVGRERDNDLSLADEGVSHRHCEFVAEQGFFVVRDLGSQNGTFVNGRRVGEARLRDGDEVRIGATRIKVALEGGVKRPDRRGKGRALGVALGFLAAGALWWWLAQKQTALHAAYFTALRAQVEDDACDAPQFEALEAADARIKGRSFALTLDGKGVRLSKDEEALDRELLKIYAQKLALHQDTYRALIAAQERRRESAEKLSRAGQRLWTARGRRTASYVDGLLQERVQAVDELLQSEKQLADETAALAAIVSALLLSPDQPRAEALQRFRFQADLRAARATCEEKNARAQAGLAGALTALEE